MKLAVIPARGGSKRIPHKNIKEFAGKPLIAYSIEAAQCTGLFDKIWVSTDDARIAEVALQHGAEVPFMRPAELSDDFTGTTPVVKHAIDYCQQHFSLPEYTCCIYATAPFLQADYLQLAFKRLSEEPQKCFAFSCTTFAFPVQRALIKQGTGVAPMFPEHITQRSQDLTEAFHDAGQFYWGLSTGFLNDRKMFSEDAIPILLPRHLVQDIDSPEDWQQAELMYQAYLNTHKVND